MQKQSDKLFGQFIVCGCGRIGSVVVREIVANGHPVVGLEHSLEAMERLRQEGTLCVDGDSTSDEILQRAKALITAMTYEAAKIYAALMVCQLNPGIQIIEHQIIEHQLLSVYNLIVIATQKPDGGMVFNLGLQEVIQAVGMLLAVGLKTDLQRFQEVL